MKLVDLYWTYGVELYILDYNFYRSFDNYPLKNHVCSLHPLITGSIKEDLDRYILRSRSIPLQKHFLILATLTKNF